jgi:signal transduction histidine kinase
MRPALFVRVTVPVVVSSLFLLALGVWAAWYVQRWQKSVSRDLRVNVAGMRAAEELEIAVREARTRLDYYLITGDRKYLRDVFALREDLERWLADSERWSITPHEQELTARVRKGHGTFIATLAELEGPAPPEQLARKVRKLIDEVLEREMLRPAHEFLDLNEGEAEAAIARNQLFGDRLGYALLLLGICGCGAGLVAGFGLARAIRRSLVQLSVPIRAAAGQLQEIVGPITFTVGRDVKDLESVLCLIADRIGAVIDRLRQSEREALQAAQLAALGQMAAGMAHELRNPLTSMKILVQGATSADPWGGAGRLTSRDLGVLEEEISRLERLVQYFLAFARPPEPEKRAIDVRPLVEDVLGVLGGPALIGRAGPTRLELRAPKGPLRWALDPGQFRQVLLNLLLNALDAMPHGGLVEVELGTGADGWLHVDVRDTGCGLPANLGERIFQPFTTTKEQGLGLGLSIVRRIVEAHGGDITAHNRPEGGATFALRFPPAKLTP